MDALSVRLLQEAELGEADRIMRVAFGTFLGLPDPTAFMGEAFTTRRGAAVVVAGVNTARRGAYGALLDRGFRAELIGVTMHNAADEGYHHPGAWVIDDWR